MGTSRAKPALAERYARDYSRRPDEVAFTIEREVFGLEMGNNGYTTVDEVRLLMDHLKLSPGMSLLDLGAGRGWPGVYVTKQSNCRTVLTDVPAPALGLARSNAIEHGVGERCLYAAADGRALPFTSGVFDAVIHADVLC